MSPADPARLRRATRCDRDLGQRFRSEAYAIEELVAEIGAAFLCARLKITPAVREDHAQYLANWLQVLKPDNKAIFTAAAKAQAAVDFILCPPQGSFFFARPASPPSPRHRFPAPSSCTPFSM